MLNIVLSHVKYPERYKIMADDDIRSKVSEFSGEIKTIYEFFKQVMDEKIILNESEYVLIKEAHI